MTRLPFEKIEKEEILDTFFSGEIDIDIDELIRHKCTKNKNGKPFDKIIFRWNEDSDGGGYGTVRGITKETDEEFNKRVKKFEKQQKAEKIKNEKRKKVLEKLSKEEMKLLGIKK